jgi:integrase
MARPLVHTMTVRHVAGRPAPWGVFWRGPDPTTGKRRTFALFFATEAEAVAEKARHEANAAALPPPPPAATAVPAKPKAAPPRPADQNDLAGDPGTFQQFAERWQTAIVSRKKPSTQKMYRDTLETHVYPTLGPVKVKAIGTEQIVLVVTTRAAAGVGWGTQKAIIRVVSSCLRWAVRFGHLSHNPCLQLTKELRDDSAGDYEEPEPNPLSAVQATAFLSWLRTGVSGVDVTTRAGRLDRVTLTREQLHARVWSNSSLAAVAAPLWLSATELGAVCRRYDVPLPYNRYFSRKAAGANLQPTPLPVVDDPARQRITFDRRGQYRGWYAYFLTLLLTGMRRGEAAGLRWQTVDLDRGLAILERNYSPAAAAASPTGDGDVTLKSKRRRTIEIDAELIPVLRDLQRIQREQAFAAGRKWTDRDYVFRTDRGVRVLSDSTTAERVFVAGMDAIGAGDERHTIHDCRDTFATLHLLKDSGKVTWVSWMLGHRQRSTTFNRYAKWVPAWAGDRRMSGDLNLTGAIQLPDAEANR